MAVQTITYDDKQYLNQNADIPATNKVQDTDMNEIKSVVNNNATILQGATTYSLNEIDTGKRWVDGKPIYRKVIYVPSLPNAGSLYIDPAITNLGYIFDIYGMASTNVPLNAARPDGIELENSVWYEAAEGKIRIVTGRDRTSVSAYVIIEYTKTTD